MTRTVLVWFRRDLRLGDNEALTGALGHEAHVVPVFVLPESAADDASSLGSGTTAWLAESLVALDASLRRRGSRLLIRRGPTADAIPRLARECRADSVRCTRDWSPGGVAEETEVARALEATGIRLEVSEGSLLMRPDALAPKSGSDAYRVFGPYFDAWMRVRPDLVLLPAPEMIPAPLRWPASDVLPRASASSPDPASWWSPGEAGAMQRLGTFLHDSADGYTASRDRPDLDGTSRLSPHLAFGEISPKQVVAAVQSAPIRDEAKHAFIRQLAWREFSAHVVNCNPSMLTRPLHREFEAMPWTDDPVGLDAWRAGMTGYPLVDAGMRQLAATGWMHNRVRMVAASLLTKHLLIDWRKGLAHFADRLTDHQVPVNVFNWQWVAGSGADAAPYFRIFNPTLQAQRHDPSGAYIRRWVPELAGVPDQFLARPQEMRAEDAKGSGVVIGADYPAPIIDHTEARERALAVYKSIKR